MSVVRQDTFTGTLAVRVNPSGSQTLAVGGDDLLVRLLECQDHEVQVIVKTKGPKLWA